jgi:hypothetical protein
VSSLSLVPGRPQPFPGTDHALQEHISDAEEVTPTSLDAPELIHPTHASASKRASPQGDRTTSPSPDQKRKRVVDPPALVVPGIQVVASPPPLSTPPQGPSVPTGRGGRFDLRDPKYALPASLPGLPYPVAGVGRGGSRIASIGDTLFTRAASRAGTTDLTNMEQAERK